ncbi:MAG: hypothetical protein CVV41_03940 [Candidatus Riflebacteria bacterium HGW-Riflebacteria-1]|jgi:hypothetical protein|nr:MAG: hypothetical protein CVV41_03940 [Candidatus Riflebacteria bacterium HGW-Riflebacteria-1]
MTEKSTKPFDPWTATAEELRQVAASYQKIAHLPRNSKLPDEFDAKKFRKLLAWAEIHHISREYRHTKDIPGDLLLYMVSRCLCDDITLPPWLSGEFQKRADAIYFGRVDKWEDPKALGVYRKKEAKERGKLARGRRIFSLIQTDRQRGKGMALKQGASQSPYPKSAANAQPSGASKTLER